MLAEAIQYKKDWQKAQRARLDSGCDNDSYVYLHLRESDNQPLYVGIGHTIDRPWDKTCRTLDHRRSIKEHGYRVEIIIDNVTEDTALFWESAWIKALRLQGFELENKSSGGQRGWVHSEESRVKMSQNNAMHRKDCRERQISGVLSAWKSLVRRKNLSENNPMKNPEVLKRNSDLRRGKSLPKMKGGFHPRARKVIEIDSGKIFPSQMEAAEYYGINNGDICAVCRGRQKTAKGYRFRYSEDA